MGHGGHQAPLNIPNIFRAAGLSARWTPGLDPLFQVGLLYPASPATGQAAPVAPPPPPPPPPAAAAYSPAASVKVKKSIPNTEYRGELPAIAPPFTGPAQVTTTSSTSPPPPATTPTTTTPTTPSPPPTIYRYRTVPPYRQSPTPASYHHNSGIG